MISKRWNRFRESYCRVVSASYIKRASSYGLAFEKRFQTPPQKKPNRGVAFDEDRVNMTLAAGETGSPETSTYGGVVVPTPRPKRRTRFQRVLATKGVLAVP